MENIRPVDETAMPGLDSAFEVMHMLAVQEVCNYKHTRQLTGRELIVVDVNQFDCRPINAGISRQCLSRD